MKKRMAYIIAMSLLLAANVFQMQANAHFAKAKVRIAKLTADLPTTVDRGELIRHDSVRNQILESARAWARPGFVFLLAGILAWVVSMVRRERVWHSMPVLLIFFHGILMATS